MLTAAMAKDRARVDLRGYTAEEHDRICRFEFEFLSDIRRLAAEFYETTTTNNQREDEK